MQIALYYLGDANDIDFWYVDDVTLMDMDAVPVELTSFTASASNGSVELNWTTATETNNKGFEIQRSAEKNKETEWEKIGFVDGGGTSSKSASYSFTDRNIKSGKYSYRLKQVDFNGSFEYSKVVQTEVTAPAEFSLKQNYPNPFNPETNISYQIAEQTPVTLTVYDLLGSEVKTLVDQVQRQGRYNITWNGRNNENTSVSSGIYFYRLKAGSIILNRKMIMLK